MFRYKCLTVGLFLLSLTFCTPDLHAEAVIEEISLKNGDRITGKVIYVNDDAYIVKTESMGLLTIAREAVEKRSGELPPVAKAAPEKEKVWSGKVKGSLDRRRGNTNTTELAGGFQVIRKTERDEFRMEGNAYYSEASRKMDAQKYDGLIRYQYALGETGWFFHFFQVEADRDRFANVDYRFTPTSGLGYWFFREDDFKLMAEVGAGATRTVFIDETESTTEMVLTPRIYAEKKLFGASKVTQELRLYPQLTDVGEYRLRSETVLSNPITERLSLEVSLIDEYNSLPGKDTKKNDVRLVTSLAYIF